MLVINVDLHSNLGPEGDQKCPDWFYTGKWTSEGSDCGGLRYKGLEYGICGGGKSHGVI
jgi:hypothetical protein